MQALYLNFLILVILHTTNAFENGMENTMIVPSLKHCSRIKCPPVHEPICAKLVNIETNNEIKVILVNKCEMQYVKCNSGIRAKVVPMKYCSQFYKNNELLEANTIRNHSDHGRVKRDLRRHGGPAHAHRRGRTRFGDALRQVYDDDVLREELMPMQKKHYKDYKEQDQNDDEDCPSVCPARAVMVCGRCKHGVYATFLSVCHMRMQQCLYKTESIQLVARYPCATSVTLLTGRKPYTQKDDKTPRNSKYGHNAHAKRSANKFNDKLHVGRQGLNHTDAESQENEQDSDDNETQGVEDVCVLSSPYVQAAALRLAKGVVDEPNDDDEVIRYIWCRDHKYQGTYCDKIRNNEDSGDLLLKGENNLHDNGDIPEIKGIIYHDENVEPNGSGIQPRKQ